jgi:ligand-binding sensor domain-containing protein
LPLILLLSFFSASGQNNLPPIGLWREHLPYQAAADLTASDQKIYCATPYSIFTVDLHTQEIGRISKVAGLSETGISTLRYDAVGHKLYIAYSNSNIDVIDEQGIHNLPDLKRENISGDKNIYQIYPDNTRCYLSTGLGVIVLDATKFEVKDSWFIGSNGGYVRTNAFTKSNNFFYAATDEGLKRTAITTANPADFRNWQTVSGSSGLPAGSARSVMSWQSKTIVLQNDSLFTENGTAWNFFFANDWPIVSINISENKLFVCERKPNGASQVLILNANGSVQKTLQQPGAISYPKNAISVNNEEWVADLFGGLVHVTGNSYESIKPNSPADVATGAMTVFDNKVYVTAGSVNDSWNYQYNRSGIFQLSEGSWTNYNQYSYPRLDSLMDFITVAVDPRDGSVWGGSYGGGLLHIKKDNTLEIFKQNSPIEATVGDPGSYRVSGLAFDADNNLWVSNFGANHQLHVLKNDGSWRSFAAPFLLNLNTAAQIVIDDANQKWIVSPLGNGVIVFDHNNTLDNTNDDKWRLYKYGTGIGNLPSNEVLSLAKDKSGFIWVGTSDGIGVVQCPQEAFLTGCEAVLPIIKDGNFANYLFKGQEVRSIAVDGANRKWVATSSGAWLISQDGDRVLAHFTEDNSPLLSSDVKSLTIDGRSGEVFFATAKGICSFRGAATEAAETKSSVLVFPNPVPPDFEGMIGIRGLPENSIVKITETNGRLVYQGRALGGQASWNGRDYRGNKAASGIYLVLATDENHQEKVVTKIVIVTK